MKILHLIKQCGSFEELMSICKFLCQNDFVHSCPNENKNTDMFSPVIRAMDIGNILKDGNLSDTEEIFLRESPYRKMFLQENLGIYGTLLIAC